MLVMFLLRIFGLTVLAILGWRIGRGLAVIFPSAGDLIWIIPSSLVGAALGFFVLPPLIRLVFRWMLGKVKAMRVTMLVAATLGLIIGLAVASLLAPPLSVLPGNYGRVLPTIVSILLGYLGMAILVAKEPDFFQFINGYLPQANRAESDPTKKQALYNGQIILDTSAIIDGRIADVSQTGFLSGTFVIPHFVLDELRHIADSSDPLRRNRGRRGLEMLNKLRKESTVPVQVIEADGGDIVEVDGRLVKLAKSLHASIVTTDFNLNRVAEFQGVKVLNINELANALKPVVLPGEEMAVKVIQEGREVGQGVGFLDDGTMIVVEGGRRHINSTVEVQVVRVLQTAAGRIVFAQPKTP